MFKPILISLGFASLLLGCASTPKKFQSLEQLDKKQTKAAVVDLLNPQNQETALGKYMADQLTLRLSSTGMQFFDRSQIRRIIEEQNLNVTSSDFAQNFGQILGADVLVLGSYYSLDHHYESTVKVVEVKNGRILSIDTLHLNHSPALSKLDQPIPQNPNQTTKKATPAESAKKIESTPASTPTGISPNETGTAENVALVPQGTKAPSTAATTPFEEEVYTNFPEKGITVGDDEFRFTLQSCKSLKTFIFCKGIAKSKISSNFEFISGQCFSDNGKKYNFGYTELYGKMLTTKDQMIANTPMSFSTTCGENHNQYSIFSFKVKFNNKEYPIDLRNVRFPN
jgi:hypothetical protein